MKVGLKTLVLLTCLPKLFLQTVYNGILPTSVTSIQTRYFLSGVDVGVILGMMDLGSIIMFGIVSIVGERANKPRWLGINSMLAGLGSLVFIIPHFVVDEYEYKSSEFVNYCRNVTEPDCSDSGSRKLMGVFMVGTLLLGLAYGALFTYCITFIDDNSTKKQSSIYVSILYMMGAIGPMIGYVVGGALTELYVDPMKDVEIDSSSPFWVGAWWPGYISLGALSLIIAIPILRMPQKLPGIDKSTPKDEEHTKEDERPPPRLQIIKDLILDPIFILSALTVAMIQAFIVGFSSFSVRYVESQFGLTTFASSLCYGISAVIFLILGYSTSAFVMARYQLDVPGMIKYCLRCALVSVIFTFGFFFYCEDDSFAGGTVKYSSDVQSITTLQLNSSCNTHCGCTADWYNPVRGSDGIVYYSPCFAGCDISVNSTTTYENCACIVEYYNNNSIVVDENATSSGTAVAIESMSEYFCPKLIGWVIAFGLAVFTSVLTIAPTTQIVIRHVGDLRKSSALGIQQVINLVLGSIPGRIITGKVMDAACAVWSTKCGTTASCKVFRKWDMALYSFILLEAETCVIFLAYLTMYFIYAPPKHAVEAKEKFHAKEISTLKA